MNWKTRDIGDGTILRFRYPMWAEWQHRRRNLDMIRAVLSGSTLREASELSPERARQLFVRWLYTNVQDVPDGLCNITWGVMPARRIAGTLLSYLNSQDVRGDVG